jgi:DNA-binding NarL/FixJ family response regulator
MKIRVLIVGVSQMFQAGIRTVLQTHRDFLVVGEVTNPSKAVEVAGVEGPDVVLIDVDVLGGEIDKLINSLHRAVADCFVLVLSDLKDEELIRKALCAGAAGVVLKIQPPAVLIAFIESLFLKKSQVEQQWPRPVPLRIHAPKVDNQESEKFTSLTTREREIARLIGNGLKNKDVADRLRISEITVRHHLTSIFSKLNVPDRQKLLIWAHQNGHIDMRLSAEVKSGISIQ